MGNSLGGNIQVSNKYFYSDYLFYQTQSLGEVLKNRLIFNLTFPYI